MSVFIGLVVGAFAGGFIMHERGYTRGKFDAMSDQGRVDKFVDELREIKISIEDLKIEQEVLNAMMKENKKEIVFLQNLLKNDSYSMDCWSKILYDICSKELFHKDGSIIIAKALIIACNYQHQ